MKKIILFAVIMLFFVDLQAKIIYTDPVQNAKYVSINNTLIIGFDEKITSPDLNSLIFVKGTVSGDHKGEIILVENGKKLLFKPFQPFEYNERVEVRINNIKTSTGKNNKLVYFFQTESKKPFNVQNNIANSENDYSENDYSLTGTNFVFQENSMIVPQPVVTISNNPSPGRLYLCNIRSGSYPSTLMIANNDASLYFSRDIGAGIDFTRQPNGLQTYFRGDKYFALDTSYNIVDSFYCGNGFSTDGHDLRVLNNGNAMVMCYDSQFVDMSLIVPGGNPNAIVIGFVIQEIDKNKNVVFQWRSWDYFDILDAQNVSFTAASIDCVHGNAIENDFDGNVMISSRHLNEITKINRATGAIIWRLGGPNNQFSFVNEIVPFHYQHDIRRLANGNITLFDNGNFRTPLYSRAVEYSLDEVNKIATLVWSYKHEPSVYGAFMGSVQRLKNGNTLVGWGGTSPMLTEVTPSGTIALEMTLPAGVFSYRAFRDEVDFTLNVKLALQGMYNNTIDKLQMKDTVSVYVRNAVSPFSIVDSVKTTIDSVTMNANCRFYNVSSGTFYITVKHRNSLETWSKVGGESFTSGGVYNYDFRTSAARAYGNNLVLKGTRYCLFSGDVNKDGIVDASDLSRISNDASSSLTGYVLSDLNGDKIVDASDLSIVEGNVSFGAITITP